MTELDAIVVGTGPNGLAAAVLLARAGLRVRAYELAESPGGGARTTEATLPGFRHDRCSAVHPLAAGSPVFASWPLTEHGLRWIEPPVAAAQTLAEEPPATLRRDADRSAQSLGPDAGLYRRLVAPFLGRWPELAPDLLRAPLAAAPRHPLLLAQFGLRAGLPADMLARAFRGEAARTLLAGMSAHVMAPLGSFGTGGIAMLFALAAHARGWPIPRGGSQSIIDALLGYFRSLGGELVCGQRVRSLRDLPAARAYLLDISPTELRRVAGDRLPTRYLGALDRYRYGPAAFKLDYALDGPVPWRDPECRQAATVHVAGGFTEVATALSSVHSGRVAERPFLITAQPSVFDHTRAPTGNHAFWAYAHVPHGWRGDLTAAVERQLERFAPGFTDRVLARSALGPVELEEENPNYIGGDIACGAFTGTQTLLRPVARPIPYATPDPSVYLCSSATPPGPGVHGQCGFHAARIALRRVFGHDVPADPAEA